MVYAEIYSFYHFRPVGKVSTRLLGDRSYCSNLLQLDLEQRWLFPYFTCCYVGFLWWGRGPLAHGEMPKDGRSGESGHESWTGLVYFRPFGLLSPNHQAIQSLAHFRVGA